MFDTAATLDAIPYFRAEPYDVLARVVIERPGVPPIYLAPTTMVRAQAEVDRRNDLAARIYMRRAYGAAA